MALERVNAGNKIPEEMNVYIQIPAAYDPIKYIVDKETGTLFVGGFYRSNMHYPCNVGYIPNTISSRESPVSVLVITPLSVNQGCIIRCRPLGMLALAEGSEIIRKIVAVPIHKITDAYQDVHKIEDLPSHLLQKIIHFFTQYKSLDQDSAVKFEGWLSIDAAKREILTSIDRFKIQKEGAISA